MACEKTTWLLTSDAVTPPRDGLRRGLHGGAAFSFRARCAGFAFLCGCMRMV